MLRRWPLLLLFVGVAACGSEPPTPVAGEGAPDFVEPSSIVLHLRGDGCAPNIAGLATVIALDGGLGVTVAHAFDELATFEVVEADETPVGADLLAMDRDLDLAVLRLDRDGPHTALPSEATDHRLGTTATVVTFGRIDDGPTVDEAEVLRRVNLTLDGEGRRTGYELGVGVEPGDFSGAVLDDDGRLGAVVFASARGEERSWSTASAELRPLLGGDLDGPPLTLTCS